MPKKIIFLFIAGLILSACTLSEPRSARHFLGNDNAPVLVEEFSDLQCPACGYISPQVKQAIESVPQVARMAYYHFPLPQHEFAFQAAEASECAADQGKFWEYVDLTFQNQTKLNSDLLYSMAKTLGLDETKFKACLTGGTKKDLVKGDVAEGFRRNVNSTPTIYVNGQEARFTSAETFVLYLRSVAAASPQK